MWYSQYLPISQNAIFDNQGLPYNVTRILLPDNTVDPAAYEAYSPLFLPTTFALTYGISFASIAALVSYTFLYHGPELKRRWKASRGELDDIHMKIMRKYSLVPVWWYGILFAVMCGFAFAAACAFPTGMKASSVVLALVIACAWTVPIGIIQAMTNIQLGLNVFTEFIISYLQPGTPYSHLFPILSLTYPGTPVAMMMFKVSRRRSSSRCASRVAD